MDVRQAHRPVVVGVDGSASALRATAWAAREAARRGAALRLVTAFEWTADRVLGQPGLGERDREQMLEVTRRRLAAATLMARRVSPDLAVTDQVAIGAPIEVLRSEAQRAVLVVLGDRGLGGLAGLVVGSVAVALAAHAASPLVVVRGERAADDRGPVVVGVDGSAVSEAALAFAFEEAAARQAQLHAVHVWWASAFEESLGSLVDWDAVAVEEQAVLAERLAGWGAKYPEVDVRRSVVRDVPARALVAASREAQLVVVGSRGRGNVTGLLLGSVSHGVLHGSHCPVAVVRGDLAG